MASANKLYTQIYAAHFSLATSTHRQASNVLSCSLVILLVGEYHTAIQLSRLKLIIDKRGAKTMSLELNVALNL